VSIKERLRELLRLHNTPHEIAFGVAIGVFIGVMPVYGLHTLIILLLALIIPDINKIAMFIGSNISIPPAIPFISWASYSIGRFILGDKCPPLKWSMLKDLKHENVYEIFCSLFVGSIVLGIICAVVSYFAVLWFVERLQKKRGGLVKCSGKR
jgi:uncharacterized protein (TIGR03546 family)